MPPVITGRKFLVRFQTFLSHKPDILLQDGWNGYRNPLFGGARHNHWGSAPTMSVSPELSNFMIHLLGSIGVCQSGVLGLSQNIAYQTCTPLLAASRKDGSLIQVVGNFLDRYRLRLGIPGIYLAHHAGFGRADLPTATLRPIWRDIVI